MGTVLTSGSSCCRYFSLPVFLSAGISLDRHLPCRQFSPFKQSSLSAILPFSSPPYRQFSLRTVHLFSILPADSPSFQHVTCRHASLSARNLPTCLPAGISSISRRQSPRHSAISNRNPQQPPTNIRPAFPTASDQHPTGIPNNLRPTSDQLPQQQQIPLSVPPLPPMLNITNPFHT